MIVCMIVIMALVIDYLEVARIVEIVIKASKTIIRQYNRYFSNGGPVEAIQKDFIRRRVPQHLFLVPRWLK